MDRSVLDGVLHDWVGAFEEVGLDVDDEPARDGGSAAPAIGLAEDEDTGAVVFVRLDGVDDAADEDDERGLASVAVQAALRLGGGRVLRLAGRKLGRLAAQRWESTHRPERVRWCRPIDVGRGEVSAIRLDDLAALTAGPSLLLLHDTLGTSAADFAALDPDLHRALAAHYDDRVWAYDHHTLHIDPAENADRLLGELLTLGREVDVDVDVVGYGRGGLVARELAARTTDGPLKVGAFATIGTPHRGTPLADAGGILAWVNRTTSLAALAPDPLSDLLTALAALVAQVVEGSIDGLRGFTALGAGPSAYLASLAEQPTATARSLFIAGAHDLDPAGGAWKAITRWAADAALDGRPNDLFVSVDSALAQSDDEARVAGRPTESLTVVGTHGSYLAVPAVERALHGWFVDGALARPEPEVAVPATASVFSEARPERPVRVALPPDGTSVAEDERSRRQHDRSRRGAQSSPTLHVRLLHSSLEHAEFPVLVGHFAGSPLSGAEERLDDCLENKLSRAQVARDYPEALGEFRHFPGYEGTPPPGAIVVGLGPMGELTESQLTAVVTRSLVRYASERRDRERAVVRSGQDQDDCGDAALGVASVLIGTSLSSGLSVESSVRAIVAGVVAANLRLGQASSAAGVDPSGDRAPIAFTELRFVARHEDMVELAARALQQLGDETSPNQDSYPVLYVPQPKIGEGAAGPNPPDDTANDVWARLRIESRDGREDGLRELTYGVMARLARADEITHAVDPALVDDLIAKSINRRSDARIGATLYELLVPHELKQPLGSGSHLHLLLDEHTADLPWELLTPRGDAFRDSRPVALGGGVLRQFVEGKDRRAAPERAPERTVLVIGNPPPGPGFGSLHGAVDEAREVVRAFESARSAARWQITARIWDTRERYVGSTLDGAHTTDPAENVIHELMTGSWRVVHIAAHGAIDPAGNAALSGVVLGPGERLTPATAGQLNIVPDLVVLNACHLGAIERQLAGMNHVAASLARRLMQIGVRAVIAAGWAVGDMAAAVFAEGLYGSLLAGRELGDAVLEARSRVHAELPTTLTWGAYQCYGDPGFRLTPRQQPHSSGALGALTVSELRRRIRATTGLVSDRTSSLSALRRDIEEVRLLADEAAGDERDLVEELHLLEQDKLYTKASPAVRADIDADLASAWTQLGEFEIAVERFRSAIGGGGKDVPLVAVEQLVNLCVRLARETSDPASQRELIGEAVRALGALDALGPTAERKALWGSFYKKRACMTDPPDLSDMVSAAACYRKALELDGERPDPYHELNARQLTAVARLAGRDLEPIVVAAAEDSDATQAEEPGRPQATATDFWSRNEQGDRLLTELVECAAGGAPGGSVEELSQCYVNAFRLRSSAANRRSVIEHLEDLATLLPAGLELREQLHVAAASLRQGWLVPRTPTGRVDDATIG